MKNMVCAIGLALFALLGSGCSSKQDIDGEAFLDLGGGASKLALVEIQIVPEDQFIAHIKKQYPKAREEAVKLKASIEEFEKADAEFQAQEAQSAALRATAGMYSSMGIGSVPSSTISESISLSNRIAASMNKTGKRLTKQAFDLASGASNVYLAGKFDGALLATTTNADGKFKLSLDSGKKVALVAIKDDLTWALWITPDKSKPTITLSNKNLTGTRCSECVFTDKVTPKSLAGF